jgi:hypothetical protein
VDLNRAFGKTINHKNHSPGGIVISVHGKGEMKNKIATTISARGKADLPNERDGKVKKLGAGRVVQCGLLWDGHFYFIMTSTKRFTARMTKC